MGEEQKKIRNNLFRQVVGLTIVSLLSLLIFACASETPAPAKDLAGSWVSSRTIWFYNQTDSCAGFYSVHDSVEIGMRWNITYAKDNIVDIVVTATSEGDPVPVQEDCHAAHQYKFPETYHGVVGGTYMVVEKSYYPSDTSGLAYLQLGKFYYTATAMSGDLTYLFCDTLQCRGYMTRPNAVGLRRELE